MEITVYAYTDRGGRAVNEDALASWNEDGRGAFTLADGLGGHSHGEIASQTVATELTALLKEWVEGGAPFDAAGMEQAFARANGVLMERQQERGSMLTTAVALAVRDGLALWGHVGDSRLYRLSEGAIEAVTEDHSVTYKKFLAGEIAREDINTDEDRCALLQAMGTRERCSPGLLAAPQKVSPGDAFLLCSDGLWEYLTFEEIEKDWQEAESAEDWGQRLARRRGERAEPGSDNFSLLTVWVGP